MVFHKTAALPCRRKQFLHHLLAPVVFHGADVPVFYCWVVPVNEDRDLRSTTSLAVICPRSSEEQFLLKTMTTRTATSSTTTAAFRGSLGNGQWAC
ncbi:hypothetical protein FLM9_276 [Candidatus Synechococcus spongiarum]|uniref:Uncharacterized protein n=1 Tax=Candidatus Synechococcus spongiarum TaxID=431041 RepID=A0A171DF42_9SYNE|nr:hypothetical protein FLM9_276 [Candidatus Synechococcus spongiarum]